MKKSEFVHLVRHQSKKLLAQLDRVNDRSTTRKSIAGFFKELEANHPKAFAWFIVATQITRSQSPRKRLEALIHDHLCDSCGEVYTLPVQHGLCYSCCSRDSSLLAERRRRGYEVRGDRFEVIHGKGIRAPQQVLEIQETTKRNNLEAWGADHPMKTTKGKHLHVQGVLDKHGVTNAMYIPEAHENQKRTNMERYGVERVLSIPSVRRKIVRTFLKRYGVNNPSQSLEVFRKKNVKLNRVVVVEGKRYTVQGSSEVAMLVRLIVKFKRVCTPFSLGYPKDTFFKVGGFPDFYLPDRDLYVECKNTWTLTGASKKVDHLSRNFRKAKVYGPEVRWVIHCQIGKEDKFFTLPNFWWEDFSKKGLLKLVNSTTERKRS